MLVLTRRLNERIVINGELVITVLEVGRNGQVRLGFEGPRHFQIYRHELLLEIQAENRVALTSAADAPADLAMPAVGPAAPAATPPTKED